MSKTEISTIIKFLWLSLMSNQEIYDALCKVYDAETVTLRTVQKWTLRFSCGSSSIHDEKRTGRPENKALRKKLKTYIKDDPYASTRELARRASCSKSTVFNIIKNELGMSKINVRWIPKVLKESQKKERIRLAENIFTLLSDSSQHELVYTQDETWISWSNPRKSMWLLSGVERPVVEKPSIRKTKLLISVIFNVNGIVSIVALPRGEKFTKKFFLGEVIEHFAKNVKIPKTKNEKFKVKLHFDNAPVHRIDANLLAMNISRVPHPPYSPDLAPCDFFLFGYLKMMLEGQNFESDEDLVIEVHRIFQSIPQSTLIRVYTEWMQRCKKCIENNGEYIE